MNTFNKQTKYCRKALQLTIFTCCASVATSAAIAQENELSEQRFRPELKPKQINVQVKRKSQPLLSLKKASTGRLSAMPSRRAAKRISKANRLSNNNRLMTTSNALVLAASAQGQSMPPASNNSSQEQAKGQGLQSEKPKALRASINSSNEASGESYLHLVMEVSRTGDVKVLSAVKAQGRVRENQEALGDFIYKVNIANKDVSLGSLQDPFELRSFPAADGNEEQSGHHFERAETARIVVKVPKIQLVENKLDTIKFDMFKLKPGREVQRINPEVFRSLQRSNRLEPVLKVPSLKLAPQIKQKMRLTQ